MKVLIFPPFTLLICGNTTANHCGAMHFVMMKDTKKRDETMIDSMPAELVVFTPGKS